MTLETLNKDLRDIFETVEFEEDGSIHITGTDWYSDDLRLEFSINTGVEGQSQLWEIQMTGVRADLIKSNFADKIELFEHHPLLWPHNQIQTCLYFGHPTTKPYELFSDIYVAHMKETMGWISFDKYINPDMPIVDLCKSAMGLFAEGPIALLEVYTRILEQHQMNPSIVGGSMSKHWTGEEWVQDDVAIKALIIGDSFVVAETFDFSRV
jgi:hypothetical protein